MRISLPSASLLAGLLTLSVLSWAQAEQVPGQVLDAATGRPLEGANVRAGDRATTTDAQGRFKVETTLGDSLDISFIGYQSARVAVVLPLVVALERVILQAPEVVVEGGLVRQRLDRLAASVTVVDGDRSRASGAGHLQDATHAVPNLNWAGGSSRPRYFQIRGIGERSHYAGEGPPSFSVGFVMDDVDLSGMGTAGLLFDVDQVEVFKGPQSTIFGPNALAGLINLRSADPQQGFAGAGSAEVGSDGLGRFSGAVNLPVGSDLALRVGYENGRSNGFRSNAFLDADDTNGRREQLLRAKVGWTPAAGPEVLGTFFWADMDNGYDAWVPDNNEDLTTYSDKPGKDRQQTTGASLKSTWGLGASGVELVTITAFSRSELEHSYDGDWGNDEYWLAEHGFDPDVEGWSYDFFDRNVRDRTAVSQEARLLVEELVVGAYWKRLEEEDNAAGYLFGGDATDLNGRYEIDNLAFYGQYGLDLSEELRLEVNARLDRNDTAYEGTTANYGADSTSTAFAVDQWLGGGKASLSYDWRPGQTLYASASRGYRSGGVNQHPYLAAENRPYDPEYIVNLELGWRVSGPRSSIGLILFHALRSDQQVELSSQQDPGDPNSFFYFTANAVKGRNSGLEWEQTVRLLPQVELFGSVGLLATHIDTYTFPTEDGEVTLGDRAAAHAPNYTFSVGGEYRHQSGLGARLALIGMDQFFYSDGHDQVSEPYRLVNAHIAYQWEAWSVQVWGRNLLDERYGVRGFYFGLEPPDYADKLYKTYGDPRQVGVRLTTQFSSLGN
ncbi:MAG: TonB-dependent receptor [Gemmatimonadetes bacterium]|nr:TonB-dependent receptor [Gemmatimonadota bacterium]